MRDWQAVEPGRAVGEPPGPAERDAEALAPDGAGGLVIAYEGTHRLRRLALSRPGRAGGGAADAGGLDRPGNAGIEALAALPDGALLALAEGGLRGERRACRLADRGRSGPAAELCRERGLRADRRRSAGGYDLRGRAAVLAARRLRDPDRDLGGRGGAGRRASGRPQPLAELRAPLVGENFEAIAARRGPDGRVLLYLVSDDNFIALQRTLLLQLSLAAPGFASAGGSERVDRAHQRPER